MSLSQIYLNTPVDQASDLITEQLTSFGYTVSLGASNGAFEPQEIVLFASASDSAAFPTRLAVKISPTPSGSLAKIGAEVLSGTPIDGPGHSGFSAVSGTADRLRVALRDYQVQDHAEGAEIVHPRPLSTTAIVALMLGFLIPPGGVVTGIVALLRAGKTGKTGKGYAIAGIAVGASLTILALVLTLTFLYFGSQLTAAPQEPKPESSSLGGDSAHTRQPSEAPTSTDVFTLKVGDCVNDAGQDAFSSVDVISCGAAHDFEVFNNLTLTGAEYPGEDQVETDATEGCGRAFEAYVGVSYDESTLGYSYFVPTRESWTLAKDRTVSCLVFDPAGQTTGSLAGSSR